MTPARKPYLISGINVEFPVNAYPSQIKVMEKILKCLNSSTHGLIESPTGSGKSLALLCSTLAWQKHNSSSKADETEDVAKTGSSSEENDSEPTMIFYCTRTHKQIKQIVTELEKTAYSQTRMTILSSREHSCLETPKDETRDEMCRRLRDPNLPGACSYYNTFTRTIKKHPFLPVHLRIPDKTPWDIEDLAEFCKAKTLCPYFLSREYLKDCELVFCPYNYILDEKIRESIGVKLNNQILIFDEAHNIEDVCRDAASALFEHEKLEDVEEELNEFINRYLNKENQFALQVSHHLITQCIKICEEFTSELVARRNEEAVNVAEAQVVIRHLDHNGINDLTLKQLKSKLFSLTTKDDTEFKDEYVPTLPEFVVKTIEVLINVLMLMIRHHIHYKVIFRKIVSKKTNFRHDQRRFYNNRNMAIFSESTSVHFCCLNPSITFEPIASAAHSIILASGTLSPIATLSSELGCVFKETLEAPHVIDSSQVWVTALKSGPNDINLKAVYENTQQFVFQDELGELVLSISKTIPFGLLLFLSSYSLLKTLSDRWKLTGLWGRIECVKEIFQEEPGKTSTLQNTIVKFNEVIHRAENENTNGGALLMAVCRGKVSEGIDFADNAARGVITVGIPFASPRDVQIKLKKSYNDCHSKSLGLLSGSKWYEIQAFRALNQALGRCIRHKRDWGAIILVDERFVSSSKYISNISKWLRNNLNQSNNCEQAMKDLLDFVAKHKKSVKCSKSTSDSQVIEVITINDESLDPSISSVPETLDVDCSSINGSSQPQLSDASSSADIIPSSPTIHSKKSEAKFTLKRSLRNRLLENSDEEDLFQPDCKKKSLVSEETSEDSCTAGLTCRQCDFEIVSILDASEDVNCISSEEERILKLVQDNSVEFCPCTKEKFFAIKCPFLLKKIKAHFHPTAITNPKSGITFNSHYNSEEGFVYQILQCQQTTSSIGLICFPPIKSSVVTEEKMYLCSSAVRFCSSISKDS